MIRPESFDMGPLNCSLERTLGDYYQDFSSSIEIVESGYFGQLDGDGVPLIDYGDQGSFRNPIVTAQYALGNLIAIGRGDGGRADRARAQLDSLVETQAGDGELAGCWPMEHDNPKYPWLRAGWISALASGNAMSALLRGWETFGDERYRASAEAAYEALHATRDGAPLLLERGGELWYEEYPAEPPLHVLNGHVYALLGVADHARVSGDPLAEERWRRAAATALAHLGEFDLGYWSAYDLRWREPVALHYQKNIHVPQLRILAALTGDEQFGAVADRWEGYLRSSVSRLRWQVALRVHPRLKKRREARA